MTRRERTNTNFPNDVQYLCTHIRDGVPVAPNNEVIYEW
jgi:hypothetical protein